MSIVITVVTPHAVVQVSDMQVTAFSDGTVVSGRQRKSMVIIGQFTACVVGWVGLARIENHNTGDWLHGQLDVMSAISMDISTIAKTLEDSATLQFALLPRTDKRCTFTLAGWGITTDQVMEPFLCRITNFDFDSAEKGKEPAVAFKSGFLLRNSKKPSKHRFIISVTGDQETASELKMYFRGLRGLLKRRVDAARISCACRQIALAVADRQEQKKQTDPRYVKTVGRNLLVLEMDLKKGAVQSRYFPEHATSYDLVADILSPGVSSKDVVTDTKTNAEGNKEFTLKGWFKINQPEPSSSTSTEPRGERTEQMSSIELPSTKD